MTNEDTSAENTGMKIRCARQSVMFRAKYRCSKPHSPTHARRRPGHSRRTPHQIQTVCPTDKIFHTKAATPAHKEKSPRCFSPPSRAPSAQYAAQKKCIGQCHQITGRIGADIGNKLESDNRRRRPIPWQSRKR